MQRFSLLVFGVFVLGMIWETAPASAQRRQPKPKVDAIESAAAALAGADNGAAVRAAKTLGEDKNKQDPRALDTLLDALALGLAPEVSVVVLTAVARYGDARALDTVLFFTRYRDPGVRAAAMEALGAIDDRRTARPVMLALRDNAEPVRAVAIGIVAARDMRLAIEPMLELLKKGDQATVPALIKMGDADVAKALGELIGEAPSPLLAKALGGILNREDFEPEAARVQVVRALSKVPGPEALLALRDYVASLPETSVRQSRREAKAFIAESMKPGGGKTTPAPKTPAPQTPAPQTPAPKTPETPGGTP